MEILSGFCEILPKPKGRPRFNSHTKQSYTPAETRNYEKQLAHMLFSNHRSENLPLKGPLSLTITFILPKPKSTSKSKAVVDVKPDLDNLVKSFLDACDFSRKVLGAKANLIENDSRVAELHARKVYQDAEKFPKVGISYRFQSLLEE